MIIRMGTIRMRSRREDRDVDWMEGNDIRYPSVQLTMRVAEESRCQENIEGGRDRKKNFAKGTDRRKWGSTDENC